MRKSFNLVSTVVSEYTYRMEPDLMNHQVLGMYCIIDKRFTTVSCRNILENIMLPSIFEKFPDGNFIFQQNNKQIIKHISQVYTVKIVYNFFMNMNTTLLCYLNNYYGLNKNNL